MVLPILAGIALRTVGTRVAAGAAGRMAAGEAASGALTAGRAMKFGGSALQMGAMRHTARASAATPTGQPVQPQQPQPVGVRGHIRNRVEWAKHNPIEAGIATSAVLGGGTLGENANNDFYRIANPNQFGG